MAKISKRYTSNKTMSWGFGEPMSRDNPLNQDNFNQHYTMQKTKPIWSKNSGLPQFFLPKFSGKDKRSSIGTQFSLAPPTNPNAVIKNKGNTYEVMQRAQPKGGIQTSTGYIMEDTLFKQNKFGYTGMDTIAGMSEQYITTTEYKTIKPQPQENPSLQFAGTMENVMKNNLPITIEKKTDTLIRGKNYANIDYPSYEYQDMKTKKAAEAAKILTTEKKETANKLYELTGGLLGEAPPIVTTGNNVSSDSDATFNVNTGEVEGDIGGLIAGKGRSYGKSYSGSKASRRASRYWNQAQAFKKDPLVHAANSIQAKLGRSPIVDTWRRIGYGSRQEQVNYKIPAKNIITDYHTKTGLISWAKTIDPEHASINPTKIISVVDTPKKVTKSFSVTTGKYVTTVRDATYKDVSVSNYGNEGVKMDMLYDKVMKKSKEKKTKYKTYYDTQADVQDYNYYAVGDEDFAAFKEHKDYLLGDISYRRSNQKEIIDRLKLDAKTIEQKDRSESIIPTLESDIDTLDTKSTVIKKQLGEHDWQKGISQDAFGTDTIQGESHVSGVLDSYGGQVRGGNYYVQDVGHLIKNTKEYESELKTEIKQHASQIESIEPDETDSLVDYFNDKSTKENAIASKDYLTKSLELTKEDRIKLERARDASAYGGNQQSTRARPKQSRGKPNPRKRSSQGGGQYKNTRTRGGQNNLGGLVI